MTLDQYIDNINKRYKLGNATEHTFRGDLQQLLESLVPEIRATNEPKRQSCGAPDYILTKKEIPVGFIEAKDIGDKDLEGAKKTGNKEQFDRYKASLNNLIFTDYLDFHLYIDGIFITKIAIAALRQAQGDNKFEIVPLPHNFAAFINLIKDFSTHVGQTIKSSKKLAEMMAGKARLLSDVIEQALLSDETHNEDSTLKDQMNAFKQILIHDITPAPVVNFIVRAVDDILKTEFDLPQGLADTSKIKIKRKVPKFDDRSKAKSIQIGESIVEEEVHRVQILDPATGTGTFLAEVVKHIHKKFEGQQGIWSNYVETHLLPRLNGFELLMASYAMAHLKLDLLLTETGYTPLSRGVGGVSQRLRVYLTNSLEEHHQDTGTLFANWLSAEANEANHIKRDTPVMCVIGNPPYAVSSTNKNEWIQNLIADYKKDLNERKINLDDDYIKFIRYGQHFIDKNGSGVLAYISNNSFIDGITHRQMRKSLLESFDKIYILDLHGSAKKNETALDGTKDENVFDIQQGVSINIFVKTSEKKKGKFAEVNHFELYGIRDAKYSKLIESNISSIKWNKLDFKAPNYFFVLKDFTEESNYNSFIKLDSFFLNYVSGIQTKRDELTIKFNESELKKAKDILLSGDEIEQIRKKLNLPEDGRDWKIPFAINDLLNNNPKIKQYQHRPFDERVTYYTGKSKGFLAYPRDGVLKHFNYGKNIGLLLPRQAITEKFGFFLCDKICDINYTGNAGQFGAGLVFPLYLYPETNGQQTIEQTAERTPNLNTEIVKQIADKLGLTFTNEKVLRQAQDDSPTTFAPIDILDYIYAVLHSPTYREKYKEFLKIDFPRVPYPKDLQGFRNLAGLGAELRQIHLLESPTVEKYITQYPISGDNVVTKPRFELSPLSVSPQGEKVSPLERGKGCVFINDTQYFDNVPQVAWEFYIGGYQPAQKWLKDRKERKLEFDDILHYQKIIVALSETDRLMKEIDKIKIN